MTVLQKIIEHFETRIKACRIPDCQSCKEQNFIVRHLQSELPAEQQQIRDVWKASELYEDYLWAEGAGHKTKPPDLETYIQSLNQ